MKRSSRTSEDTVAASSSCTIYEHLGCTPLAADGIRPGGLKLTERGLTYCRFAPESVVLDIGCGTGVTLEHLHSAHGLRAVGIDPSSLLVTGAQARNPSLAVVRGRGDTLPFSSESFDGVILECTLSLIEDHSTALNECHRALRAGGRLIVSDLYVRNPEGIAELRSLPLDCCLRGARHQDELAHSVRSAGFAMDVWEDHSDLLREFAVQIIWSYGSMESFLGLENGQKGDGDRVRTSIERSRPGYFLLVGHKAAGNEE